MDLELKQKRALVFASSSGLGKAVATSLIKEGVQTIVSSSNKEKLQNTAKEIGAIDAIQCDLTRAGSAQQLVESAIERLGGLDILITNAGGPPAGSFQAISLEQWQTGYQSLFLSLVEAFHLALPVMAEQKWGRIVLITSIAGREPIAGLTVSNALRAGVHGLVNSLSKEYGKAGITINALLPTYTDTERLRELKREPESFAENIPVGRLGQPDELGKLAAFLCSPHAGFITGQAIAFDGGSSQSI